MLRTMMRCAAAALAAWALVAPRAGAQVDPLANLGDPVETVNRTLRAVPDGERSELALLPAIAAMAPAPHDLDLTGALLLTPSSAQWGDADAWADAPAQRAALEALEGVTNWGSRFRFALGYGDLAVDSEIKATGLHPALTDGRLLAGMRHRHLDALDSLFVLVLVEAERRVVVGRPADGIDLLGRMLRLARSVADRPFYAEKVWALQRMIVALEAMRDLIYVHRDAFDEGALLDSIRHVDARDITIDRLRLGDGDRLAALQLVRETFVRLGKPDPARFGAAMALVSGGERSLAMFGDAGWWRRVGEGHADYYTTIDAVQGLYRDWQFRWDLSPFDDLLDQQRDYDRLDEARHALILEVAEDQQELFRLRQRLRAESAGTRLSMGVLAHRARIGSYPSPLSAIRPRYVREIDVDPYDPQQREPFRYFVPIRDQPRSEREAPRPHTIQVLGAGRIISGADGDEGFEAALAGAVIGALGDFGPDQAREMAAEVPLELARPMVVEALRQIAQAPPGTSPVDAIIQQAQAAQGLMGMPAPTEEEVGELRRLLDALLAQASVRSALDTVRAGGTPSDDAIRALLADAIETFFSTFVAELAGEGEAGVSDAFSVDLDDSVFVLYSVGEDGAAQMVRSVGPAGTDYMLWPPVISLVREQMGGR